MGCRPQAPRLLVRTGPFDALRQGKGLPPVADDEAVESGAQVAPALLFQLEKQSKVRPAAPALRALLHLGSADGTVHESGVRGQGSGVRSQESGVSADAKPSAFRPLTPGP